MESTGKSISILNKRYAAYGKKAALAAKVETSESQLSKTVGTHGERLCRVIDELGLALVDEEYVRSLEAIVRHKL